MHAKTHRGCVDLNVRKPTDPLKDFRKRERPACEWGLRISQFDPLSRAARHSTLARTFRTSTEDLPTATKDG
jgi:hypothetical protein